MDFGAATTGDPHFAGTFVGNRVSACLQLIWHTHQTFPNLLSKDQEVQQLPFADDWDSLPVLLSCPAGSLSKACRGRNVQ